jgi:signal transduction histidine kinase
MPLFHLSSPGPFFDNKVRAFWNLQILGWTAWLGLRGVSGLAYGQPFTFLIPQTISAITGFSLTLILAVCYRALISRRPLLMWGVSFGLAGLATALWAFIDAWVAQIQNPASTVGFTSLLLGAMYINATSLAAWSALYFAINYFLQLEEQNDRVIRLEAQAASAQLAMLRYQLNPHFLFNTLNAISTLVLDGRNAEAEKMLLRLSSFLRHTVDADAVQRSTLSKEAAMQREYLIIESTRFGDRLRCHCDTPESLGDCIVPSLLMQPIVENALKYAVAVKTGPANLWLGARAENGRLILYVEDDGPGLPPDIGSRTGVGWRNTRERLATMYHGGAEMRILEGPRGGGVLVELDMPLERAPAPAGRPLERSGT